MKKFITKLFILFFALSAGLTALYAILDPTNETIGDVRYVKTRNIITSDKVYNTILIGSSRVFDVGEISDCNYSIYNYGFIQAIPEDFPKFIEHATLNHPIKKVIIGLDFFGSSEHGLNDVTNRWKKSEDYIQDVQSETLFTRIISIYDFQRFKRVINYKILKNDPFSRSNIDQILKVNAEWKRPFWAIYRNAYSNYKFNENLSETFRQIRKSCEGIELIVYITPESQILFELMIEMGLESDYQRFLKMTTENFGSVINMMEINEFTKSPMNFKDESHLTNKSLHTIVCNLANESIEKIPATVLTNQNIDNYINKKLYKSK